MKKRTLLLALAVAAFSLPLAAPAAADCDAVFGEGARYKLLQQRAGEKEKTVVVLVVEKRQGDFVGLTASTEKPKSKMTLIGGVSGATAIFTNSQNMRTWSCTCGKTETICKVEDVGFKGEVKLEK